MLVPFFLKMPQEFPAQNLKNQHKGGNNGELFEMPGGKDFGDKSAVDKVEDHKIDEASHPDNDDAGPVPERLEDIFFFRFHF